MTPRQKAESAESVSVDSIRHRKATRKNIPTEELRDFIVEEEHASKVMRYPRNSDLDPQLVWKGKDEQDSQDFGVPVVPIYIQEKIHPQAIIEDVRASARKGQPGTLDIFSDFNGLGFEQMIEFYQHDQHWQNRMILGDSLLVMTSLAEKEGLKGQVQMIYLDPPYGIKFNSNWQVSTRKRDVKDGKAEDATRQPEQIKAFRDTWELGIHSYLAYLRDRLVAAHELLLESGSLFVQIGEENVHLVRCIMDEVFGSENYVALITFKTTSDRGGQILGTNSDYILWYTKKIEQIKNRTLFTTREYEDDIGQRYTRVQLSDGARRFMNSNERENPRTIPDGAKVYRHDNLTSQGTGESGKFPVSFNGVTFTPGKGTWKTHSDGMQRLQKAERLAAPTANSLTYVRFFEDFPCTSYANVWTDTQTGAFTDPKVYVVQTNTKVIERCMLMSTDPGDLVLDPTCGSGTTAYVAEQWGRRWITIDTSRVALALARTRLMAARYPYYLLADSEDGMKKQAELIGKLPAPIKPQGDIKQGFVYKTVPHITLKAIANNLEIDTTHAKYQEQLEPLRAELNAVLKRRWEEWEIPREAEDPWAPLSRKLFEEIQTLRQAEKLDRSALEAALHVLNVTLKHAYTLDTLPERPADPWPEPARELHRQWWDLRRQRQAEIDTSIARNANTETLYDQPYEDKKRVRVTGPFTVESLSPHRVLSTNEERPVSETQAQEQSTGSQFEMMVLDNLRKAGVQNTIKNERLKFDRLEPYAGGAWLHAEGEYTEKDGAVKRVTVSIGPEHGTVGPEQVKEAAKEAIRGLGFDLLLICGFAFDPHVSEEAKRYGKLIVLPTKMNPDLAIGEALLKKTGSGNLFMVFGEPDIQPVDLKTGRIKPRSDGKIQIEIRGLDIYDPTTGQIRSNSTDDIACWFIDTNYNGESFFVRHAYFTGTDDPYDKLKRALRAEIGETAWSALYSTKSRPFDLPETDKIAVKVINHYGDEVLKVFKV